MVKYPRLLAEIANTLWAITTEGLDGIYKAIDGGLEVDDRILFHKAAEGAFDLFDDLGESRTSFIKDGIGYLFVDGPIIPRDSAFQNSSGAVSIQSLTRDFRALESNYAVDRIRLIVDSPGGAVTGVSEFANMLASSDKLIESYNVGQMSSAAYWIGAATERIFAADTSLSGSIGVLFRSPKFDTNVIVSSQSPNKYPNIATAEGRSVLQGRADDIADIMISFIAEQRGVSFETVVSEFGKGGVLIASKALEVGMIDGIATLSEFVSGNLDNAAMQGVRGEVQTPESDKRAVQAHIDRYRAKIESTDQKQASTETLLTKESSMEETQVTPSAPKSDSVAVEEYVAKAVAAERVRLKAIEAVKVEFAREDSRIQGAVAAVIDGLKFEATTTVDTARTAALQAAFQAQKELITAQREARTDLGSALSAVPTEPIRSGQLDELDKDRIAAIRKGFEGGA